MTDHVAITAPTLAEPQLFSALHPELAAWFAQRFTHFSPAQRAAVPEILAGHSTLLSAPTGSGKTLAAFLGVFDSLAKLHAADALPNGIVAVYISRSAPSPTIFRKISSNRSLSLAGTGCASDRAPAILPPKTAPPRNADRPTFSSPRPRA